MHEGHVRGLDGRARAAGEREPVAVLDTIGVSPEYAERGVGSALLGFFCDAGFAPAQRLAFVRRVAA